MTQTLEITLPKAWSNVLQTTLPKGWRRGDFVIEHPELDVRSVQVTLAIAADLYSRGRSVTLYAPDARDVVRGLIRTTYASLLGTVGNAGSYDVYEQASIGELHVSFAVDTSKLSAPVTDHVIIAEGHRLASMPPVTKNTSILLFTPLCLKDSWQYELARVPTTVLGRMSLGDALKSFPDQKEEVLPKYDPFYGRKMLVEDVHHEVKRHSNFVSFARQRIHIVTQKPVQLLTVKQREAAKNQYGEPLVPLDLSRLQKKYVAMKRLAVKNGKRPWYVLVKYRRGGFTTIEQASSYRTCVESPRSTVVTLADSIGKTRRIFNMVSIMQDNDPRAPKLSGDSKSHLEMANGSTFFIGTAGSKAFARGDTLARAHGSEVAFWCQGPNQTAKANEVLAGIMGAAEYGEITLESTPNGRNFFYSMYTEAKNNQSEYVPIFLPWFEDPMNRLVQGTYNEQEILETLDEEELDLIAKHNLNIDQIAYRRQKKREFGVLFPQEFPEDDESCFLVSGLCFFSIDKLTSTRKRITKYEGLDKPIHKTDIPGGYEVVWQAPKKGRKYAIGCDTSEGLGPPCDMNGLGIVDKSTGEQVAALHGRWKPEELAAHVCRMSDVYNKALMGIERNNHGHSVLNTIKTLGYDRPHYLGGSLYYYSENRAGFSTDPKTRPQILDAAAKMLSYHPEGIHDEQYISECGSFRLQTSGKWAADPGAHDDTVIKWGIAYLMREVPIATPTIDFI